MVRKREAVEKRVMKTQGRFKRKKKRGSKDGSVKKEEAIHTRKINEVCVCVCVWSVTLTYKGDWKVIRHMGDAAQGE